MTASIRHPYPAGCIVQRIPGMQIHTWTVKHMYAQLYSSSFATPVSYLRHSSSSTSARWHGKHRQSVTRRFCIMAESRDTKSAIGVATEPSKWRHEKNTSSRFNRIAVFCGSSVGKSSVYMEVCSTLSPKQGFICAGNHAHDVSVHQALIASSALSTFHSQRQFCLNQSKM